MKDRRKEPAKGISLEKLLRVIDFSYILYSIYYSGNIISLE